jgi:hypothetical protein
MKAFVELQWLLQLCCEGAQLQDVMPLVEVQAAAAANRFI